MSIAPAMRAGKYCAPGRAGEERESANAAGCRLGTRIVATRGMTCAVLQWRLREEWSGGAECEWALCRKPSSETTAYGMTLGIDVERSVAPQCAAKAIL